MATSGAFWNFDNPMKPNGIIDPDAILDIPFDLSDWLAATSDTIASWTIIPDLPITNVSSSAAAGVIVAFIAMNGAAIGNTLKVTCRFITSGGRTDERTVYLNVIDR